MSKKTTKPNQTLICDYCGKTYMLRGMLIRHLRMHSPQKTEPNAEELVCLECHIQFKNKGLLMCHNAKVHQYRSNQVPANDNSKEKQQIINIKFRHVCPPCQITFYYQKDLMFHVRQYHFNLLSQIPYSNFKRVNQIWFEKVLNSKSIVEIKKVAQNILLMRKLDDNTAMKVGEHTTEDIDLRDVYPFHRIIDNKCKYCLKVYNKNYIKRHIQDVHFK